MEFWQLYDENHRPLPDRHPRQEPLPPGTFYRAVGIWVIDPEGRFLLTLRSPEKKEYPNCWENPGGAVQWGESPLHAARRELFEETGIRARPRQLIHLASTQSPGRLMDSYLLMSTAHPRLIHLQKGETCAACQVTLPQLLKMADSGALAAPIGKTLREILPAVEYMLP